ncbi:unnamed protein product, partial [Durusdinium trenchii]
MDRQDGSGIPLREVMTRAEMKNSVLCRYYANNTCTRGARCRFAHRLDMMVDWPIPPTTRLRHLASGESGSSTDSVANMARTTESGSSSVFAQGSSGSQASVHQGPHYGGAGNIDVALRDPSMI